MSTLVVQIPPRDRLRAGAAADAPPRAATDYAWASSDDGVTVTAQGSSPAALLPQATSVVAVLADGDVAWQRVTVPRANAAKMRAALAGALEEALLEEPDALHFALAPQAAPGEPAWVAVVDKRWLQGELAALEKAGFPVDRVVPSSWPDNPPSGHFTTADATGGTGVVLHWAHADGVASLPIAGTLARALVPWPPSPSTRWSATPAAASGAEQWLGLPVGVMPPAERALQAARSLWNLRQFELAARGRGLRALRDLRRALLGPAWRPVRVGLVALVAVQLVGLNLWAWQLRQQVEQRRAAIGAIVRDTFPGVNAMDVQRGPAAVMQREVQALRARAGRLGDQDLETLLGTAAAALPPGTAPVGSLRFEPGRLSFGSTGWTPDQVGSFRAALQPAGWLVEVSDTALTLRRAPGAGS